MYQETHVQSIIFADLSKIILDDSYSCEWHNDVTSIINSTKWYIRDYI